MGIVIRQSIKTSIVTFSGAILGACYNVFARNVLLPNEVGISTSVTVQGATLQPFLLLGSVSVVFGYLQRYPVDSPKRPAILTLSFLLPLLASIVFFLPYLLLRVQIVSRFQSTEQPYIQQFFLWVPLLSFLSSYLSLLEVFLSSRLRPALAILGREVVLRCCNMGILALTFFKIIDFNMFVVGTVLVYLVPLGLLLINCLQDKNFRFSLKFNILAKSEIKEIVKYAWYHMLTGLTLSLMGYLDMLILQPLAGGTAVSIYALAQMLVAFIIIPYRAMINAVFANLNEAYFAGNKEKLANLFRRAGLNMLTACSVMYIILIPNLHNFTDVFHNQIYRKAEVITIILALGQLVNVASGINNELISITPKYKINFRLSVLLILMLLMLDRLIIPKWGVYGAAWVTCSTMILINIIKMYVLYKETGLQPVSKHSALVIALTIATAGAGYLLPHFSNPFIDVIARTPLLLFAFMIIIYKMNPNSDIVAYVKDSLVKRKLY